jgi:hypothetical protein
LPFAKRVECASCENAQHLPCQPSRKLFPRKLSARLSHCLFPRAIRPAIASHFSPLCYPLPLGKRNLTPTSRDVLLFIWQIISCYYVARHNINGLRKRTPPHKVRQPRLLRLATHHTKQGMAGNAPHTAPHERHRTMPSGAGR